jgi:hypothetical protein
MLSQHAWLLALSLVLCALMACELPDGDEAQETLTPQPSAPLTPAPPQDTLVVGGQGCCPARCMTCRQCRTGKACGDTCISMLDTCRIPEPGCACNAP